MSESDIQGVLEEVLLNQELDVHFAITPRTAASIVAITVATHITLAFMTASLKLLARELRKTEEKV